MSGPESEPADDGALVAYLDGELTPEKLRALEARLAGDASLRERLERLRQGGRPFAAAFEPLLRSAPQDRLEAMLAGITASRLPRGWPRLTSRPAAAAAVLLFLLGAAAGYLVPRAIAPDEEVTIEEGSPDYWRQAVAEYLTLYTRDTLAGIPEDPALRAQELAAAGAPLSLDLGADKVALPALALKRAQTFALDGRPLAQVAYLSERDGPVAFCIIAGVEGEAPRRFEERLGSAIVYWSKAGRGYMLIGRVPRQELETLAATLDARVS